jgi:hypothetical protein
MRVPFWWGVGVLVVLFSLLEILLRKNAPEYSLAFFLRRYVQGLDVDLAMHNIDYMPGCELAVALGYTGAGLMLTGILYVARRRFPFLKNAGSLRSWFDWHVMSGTIGPLLIVLHSAGKLDNWVSLGVWAMLGSFLSGLLGRYLTTQLPEMAAKSEIEKARVREALSKLRERHPGVAAAEAWFDGYRRTLRALDDKLSGAPEKTGRPESIAELKRLREKPAPRVYTFGGAIATFFWVLWDDLRRGSHKRRLKRALRSAVAGKGAWGMRRQAARHALELMLLERRGVLLPRLEPLYSRWKVIHVPFAVVLTVLSTIHIWIEMHR